MTETYPVSPQNKTRQLKDLARYDKRTVHSILAAAQVAQVGFVQDGAPVVVPMIFGRDGETLYLHGARKARVIKLLDKTDKICVNVTLIDGLVLARSAFNSSMNYRSVTLFGQPTLVDSSAQKLHALRIISEHNMPGRWDELRPPHDKEIKMTGVIAMSIDFASAKVSASMPDDEVDDYAIPVWAGVLPLQARLGELVDDDRLLPNVQASAAVRALQNRVL